MRIKDWLRVFKSYQARGIEVIHISALKKNMSGKSLIVALNRLEKTGIIARISKGWICIQPREVWEIVKIVFPSAYISLEWALHYHEIIDQAYSIITLIWLGKPKTIRNKNYIFELHRIKPKLYFGFDGKKLAEPEKALLDTIYIRRRLPGEINIDLLNIQKILKYSKKYPKSIQRKVKSIL